MPIHTFSSNFRGGRDPTSPCVMHLPETHLRIVEMSVTRCLHLCAEPCLCAHCRLTFLMGTAHLILLDEVTKVCSVPTHPGNGKMAGPENIQENFQAACYLVQHGLLDQPACSSL